MINWKLRFKNKTTLIAIILGVIQIVYMILDLFHIIPPFDQESLVKIAMAVVDVLVLIGVIVDPTTDGITDSARAMTYTEPNNDKVTKEG